MSQCAKLEEYERCLLIIVLTSLVWSSARTFQEPLQRDLFQRQLMQRRALPSTQQGYTFTRPILSHV